MSIAPIFGAESSVATSEYIFPIISGIITAALIAAILIILKQKKNQPQKNSQSEAPLTAFTLNPEMDKSSEPNENPGDRTTEILIRHVPQIARMSSWSIEVKTGALTWSKGLPQLFGRSEENMPKTLDGMITLYPQERQKELKAIIQRVQTQNIVDNIEYAVVWPDGSSHWIMSHIELTKSNSRDGTYISGVSVDITERKRMEEELRLKEQLLSRAFEAAGVGVWEWDTKTNKVTWNGLAEDLFGIKPGTFAGTFEAYLNEIHPDDVEHVKSVVTQAQTTGGGFRVEHRVRNNNADKASTDRWLAGRGDILRDESGQTIGMAGVIMDVTMRRRAEKELRISEERYRAVVTSMAEGVIIHAADASIIECNHSAEIILGLSRDQLLGLSNTDPRWHTIDEDGARMLPEEHPSTIAQKTGQSVRKKIIGLQLPAGTQRWLSVNADPLFSEKKTDPIGVVVTISDITHRLIAERQLRDSEKRWRALAENIPDYIAMVDRLGTMLFINHLPKGLTREDVLGAPIDKFMPTEFSQLMHNAIERIFDKGEIVTADIQAEGDHHSIRWYSCHISPVKQQERTIAATIRATDITDRKEAEILTRQHEQERIRLLHRLETLIDRMPIGCIMWDKDGKIASANPAVERIYGFSASELIGDTIFKIAPQIKLDDIKASHAAPSKGAHVSLMVGTAKSGKAVTCEWHSTLTHDDNGEVAGVISMMMDISDRELLEEELRQSQKMEAIGKLAGGIAHDFNNLLTAIMGYSELLSNRLSVNDGNIRHVEQIKKAAQRAAGLTYQLLAFSRKQVLQSQHLAVNSVIQDLETLLRRLIGEHISLQINLSEEAWNILADANQIEQVVMNLAVNARDAMRTGGTLTIITKNITLDNNSDKRYAELPRGDYVVLSIKDTGEGMTPDVRRRIFEPFFTTKPEGKGTGLGLAVVFGIVRQTGGHIFVESDGVGLGTIFEILLPRAVSETETRGKKDSTTHLLVRGDETILLVEDDEAVRSFAKDTLEANGYKVLAVADGAHAIETSMEYPGNIDVLLTDVVMPVIGGREVADEIMKKRPTIRVLFMSGYTDDMVLAHGVAEGTKAFIEKPFTAPKLLGRIRRVIGGNM